MKTVQMQDFLTGTEIRAAWKIFDKDRIHFHKRVLDEVILPNMPRINKALGQDNDAQYLAYAVEYALGSAYHD